MNSPTTRKALVESLVRLDSAPDSTVAALHEFGWDCDQELVPLEPSHVGSVLNRYLAGILTADEVEAWAEAIEGRDDIDFGGLLEVVFELANPAITRTLSPARVEDLLSSLGSPAA